MAPSIPVLVVAMLLMLTVSSKITRVLLGGTFERLLLGQTIGMSVLGVGFYVFFNAPIMAVVLVALVPFVIQIIGAGAMYLHGKLAARGHLGEEGEWIADLFDEGDEEFIEAAKNLPDNHMKEVVVMAEDKEEFRELTVDRYEQELADES